MTLLVQSSSESLRTAASSDGSELSITAPPALVAGDMLCIAVSASCLGEVIISGVKDGEPVNDPIAGLSTDVYTSTDGKVVFGYSFVPRRPRPRRSSRLTRFGSASPAWRRSPRK